MLNYNKKNKGQILVITLFVMFILSIIVMSTTNNITRSLQERGFSESYEENYAFAESRIIQAVDYIKTVDLNTVTPSNFMLGLRNTLLPVSGDFTNAWNVLCNQGTGSEYSCDVTDGCTLSNLNVKFTNKIESLEMGTSDALNIDLRTGSNTSYTGPISVSWTGDVIWSITMIYQRTYGTGANATTVYDTVKDTYDQTGDVTPYLRNPSFVFNPKNRNSFVITGLAPAQVTDRNFDGGGASSRPLILRLRPIIKSSGNIYMSLQGRSNLPVQFVSVYAQTKNSCNTSSSPTPLLSIKVPANPAPPALFDYVYYDRKI